MRIKGLLFTKLVFLFIIMTPIGTLTHEMGHGFVAKALGYDTKLTYKSMGYSIPNNAIWNRQTTIYEQFKFEIDNNLDFPFREEYNMLVQKSRYESHLILLGGPLQTMLTGSIGIMLLFLNRKRLLANDKISITAWILIFMSLFWLRQIANTSLVLYMHFIHDSPSIMGDEIRVAQYYQWSNWSLLILTAAIGIVVILGVFYWIPKSIRFTFFVAGIVGGLSGAYLWFMLLGPKLLPVN